MKVCLSLVLVAAVGVLLVLPQAALSQTEGSSTTTTETNNPRAVPVNPHDVTNNTVPTEAGSGFNTPSQWGRANAVYVNHEIEKARANGKDVTVAQAQYKMGMTDLNKGMNREAAQHFDSALESVGVQPKAQGQNPGEPMPGHGTVPAAH
jgi:hypothetical protein